MLVAGEWLDKLLPITQPFYCSLIMEEMTAVSNHPNLPVQAVLDNINSAYQNMELSCDSTQEDQDHQSVIEDMYNALPDTSPPGVSEMDGYYTERITIPTADTTVNVLRQHFSYYKDSSLKKAQSGSSLCHCQHGTSIGNEYLRLRQLMLTHARLELLKDVSHRIQQFEAFIVNLRRLVRAETMSWLAINNASASELSDHQTNLIALSSICDEFRMHLNHWMCIKQRIDNNRWLRCHTPDMLEELRRINKHFIYLQETAFWWTEKLLKYGMQVFAYVDRRSLTYNDVFSIVRGIEEFNTLIHLVRMNSTEMKASSVRFPNSGGATPYIPLIKHMHTGKIDSAIVKAVPFVRLINNLATEWAKSAAAISLHCIGNHASLTQAMRCKRHRKVEDVTLRVVTSRQQSPDLFNRAVSTSDYFSESLNRTQTFDEDIVDLTCKPSPLLDFGKKERDYIGKVIQIACQRTNLLRKNKFSSSSHSDKKLSTLGECSSAAVTDHSNDSHFIRNDGKRKSVSWGDSHDMALCRQLTSKYDDALWKAYGGCIEDSLCYAIEWSSPGRPKTSIGSLDLCTSDAVTLFVNTLITAAQKGFFTSLGSKQICQKASALQLRSHMNRCDLAISSSLAAMLSDKASPVPLHNSMSCTRTARLLRNALHYIKLQLQGLYQTHSNLPPIKSGSPSHQSYVDYKTKLDCINRLQVVCDLAVKWCLPQANRYLNSYKISSYILITQCDLPILTDEIEVILRILSGDLFAEQVQILTERLQLIKDFHDCTSNQLYKQACKLSNDILAELMPNHKIWKQRNRNGPPQVQAYAESLVEGVVMPVFDGVKQLDADSIYTQCNGVLAAVCKTWSEYFLCHKIKFSVQGVEQLRTDFSYLLDYIDISITSETTKSKLLASEPLIKFRSIIDILAEQPRDEKTNSDGVQLTKNKVSPLHEAETKGTCLSAESKVQWANLRARIPGRHPIFPCLRYKS